ncbi:MAG: peptide deformylase [Alphaproteobacteria bacterium 33-17]|nr:MAG: peptide deformylase [Alphaproteobacteria bacterium 33-17]
MAVLPIVVAPDPRLKKPSENVEKMDDETKKFIADMIETMYHAEGVGLAAVQVGVHKKIITLDVSDNGDSPQVFINAELVKKSEETKSYKEGCLSFPGQYSDVIRPDTITVRYRNEAWEECELEAAGLLAVCLQHEIDHTNGIVFVDHISDMKRRIILEKLRKKYK